MLQVQTDAEYEAQYRQAEQHILKLGNEILAALNAVDVITDIQIFQTDEFYIQIFHEIFGQDLGLQPGRTQEQIAENIDGLLNMIEEAIPDINIEMLNGDSIVEGDLSQIMTMLELICELIRMTDMDGEEDIDEDQYMELERKAEEELKKKQEELMIQNNQNTAQNRGAPQSQVAHGDPRDILRARKQERMNKDMQEQNKGGKSNSVSPSKEDAKGPVGQKGKNPQMNQFAGANKNNSPQLNQFGENQANQFGGNQANQFGVNNPQLNQFGGNPQPNQANNNPQLKQFQNKNNPQLQQFKGATNQNDQFGGGFGAGGFGAGGFGAGGFGAGGFGAGGFGSGGFGEGGFGAGGFGLAPFGAASQQPLFGGSNSPYDFDIPLDIKMPTKIDIQPTDQDEESDEEDSDEIDEEENQVKEESHKLIDHILDEDKPVIWDKKQQDQKEKPSETKNKHDKADEEDYSEDFHSSAVEEVSEDDPYSKQLKRSRELMDKTESFKDDSKSDVNASKVIDTSKDTSIKNKQKISERSNVEVKPIAKPIENKITSKITNQKRPAVQQYDEVMDDLEDDDLDDEEELIKNVPDLDGKLAKLQSKEWNPVDDHKRMKDMVEKYRSNYDDLSKDDKKLVEQELLYHREINDNSFSQSDRINQSSEKSKASPPLNYKKKLTVVEEENNHRSSDENIGLDEYKPKPTRVVKKDPEPRVNEKGEAVVEFKEKDLPELDIETLAAIRDQLLLQKMYENDLKSFKKFKSTQKQQKGKRRTIKSPKSKPVKRKTRFDYNISKPKGYEDISQKRYEELLFEVEEEVKAKEISRSRSKSKSRPKSKSKRPQTAHYPLKSEFDDQFYPATKKKKRQARPKLDSNTQSEYINIIKKYEDVLKDKVSQKK